MFVLLCENPLALCVSPGVTVKKGQEEVEVLAPVVISDAGIFNTFQKFLSPDVNAKPGKRSPSHNAMNSHSWLTFTNNNSILY